MIVRILAALALCLVAYSLQAKISASVDRTVIGANESIQLHITSDQPSQLNRLRTDQLEALFSIVSRATSQQIQLINGRFQRSVTLTLTMFPNQSGRLVIPALEVGGETTDPITILVGAQAQGNASQSDSYAELTLSTATPQVLNQQQLVVTMLLRLRADKFSEGRIDALEVSGAQVVFLGEQKREELSNNHPWQVIERRYAVFPQQSGNLSINPVIFNGILVTRGGSLFPSGRNYRLRSNSLTLEVEPPAYTDAPWLPATNLTASSNLSATQVEQGQAVTRNIVIQAESQMGELLPELALPHIQGVQGYLDGVERNNQQYPHGVDGKISIKQVFIPAQDGNFTIPEQQIVWYNTRTKRRELLRIPAAVFTANSQFAGGNNDANPLPDKPIDNNLPTTVASHNLPWAIYVLAGLLLASLLGNLLLWRHRASTSKQDTPLLPNKEDAQFAQLVGQQLTDARRWLVACNHWLATLGAQQVHSAQGLCQLIRTHNQDSGGLQTSLEQWFYHGDAKPPELSQYLQAIRTAYGYPRTYGVYNSSLFK